MNLRQVILVAATFALGLVLSAPAAFTPPTPEQLQAAATDPSANLAALLQDANANQAAAIVKELADLVAGLGLSADEQTGRLVQAVQILFSVFPSAQYESLAAALGETLAESSGISAGIWSAIREAIVNIDAGGNFSGALLQSFDQAWTTGGGTLLPAPNPEPPESEPSSSPTQATDYPGQNIP